MKKNPYGPQIRGYFPIVNHADKATGAKWTTFPYAYILHPIIWKSPIQLFENDDVSTYAPVFQPRLFVVAREFSLTISVHASNLPNINYAVKSCTFSKWDNVCYNSRCFVKVEMP